MKQAQLQLESNEKQVLKQRMNDINGKKSKNQNKEALQKRVLEKYNNTVSRRQINKLHINSQIKELSNKINQKKPVAAFTEQNNIMYGLYHSKSSDDSFLYLRIQILPKFWNEPVIVVCLEDYTQHQDVKNYREQLQNYEMIFQNKMKYFQRKTFEIVQVINKFHRSWMMFPEIQMIRCISRLMLNNYYNTIDYQYLQKEEIKIQQRQHPETFLLKNSRIKQVSLKTLMQTIKDLFQPYYVSKQIDFIINSDVKQIGHKDDDVYIVTDKKRLRQILLTYIQNSINKIKAGYIYIHYREKQLIGYPVVEFVIQDTCLMSKDENKELTLRQTHYSRFTKLDLDFNLPVDQDLHDTNNQSDSYHEETRVDKKPEESDQSIVIGLDVARFLVMRLGPTEPATRPIGDKGERLIFQLYQNIEDFLGKEHKVVYQQDEDLPESEPCNTGLNNYRFLDIEKYQNVTKAAQLNRQGQMPQEPTATAGNPQKDAEELECPKINNLNLCKTTSLMTPIDISKGNENFFFNQDSMNSNCLSTCRSRQGLIGPHSRENQIESTPQAKLLAQLYQASENSDRIAYLDKAKSRFGFYSMVSQRNQEAGSDNVGSNEQFPPFPEAKANQRVNSSSNFSPTNKNIPQSSHNFA